MSEEVGKLLRELREKKGYTIDDIQEITKIRSRYLRAIEEGNLHELPGSFYAKAFVKSYGEVVGLQPEVIEEYQNAIPDPEIDELPSRTAHSIAKPPSKMGKFLKKGSIYTVFAIVLLLIYALIVTTSSNDSKQSTDDLNKNRLETSEKPVEKQQQPNKKATEQPPSTPQSTPEAPVVSDIEVTKIGTTSYKNRSKDVYEVVSTQSVQNIELQLSFNDSCWFEIRKGGPRGKLVVMNTLNKGQTTDKILLDDQELWIHLGNASGVELNINNEKIPAGNEPGPKYISVQKKK